MFDSADKLSVITDLSTELIFNVLNLSRFTVIFVTADSVVVLLLVTKHSDTLLDPDPVPVGTFAGSYYTRDCE